MGSVIGDALVVDAVVHPYNLSAENQNPAAAEQLEAVYAAHLLATGEEHAGYQLTREEFFSDFPFLHEPFQPAAGGAISAGSS